MVIQYQNTMEQYVEASRALADRQAKKRRPNIWASIVIVIYFCAAISFYKSFARVNELIVYFHILSPIFLAFFISIATLCIMSLMTGKLPRIRPRLALHMGILIVILCPVILIYTFLNSITPAPRRFVWTWDLFLPHSTWMFFVVWLTVAGVRQRRNKMKKMWSEQPSLGRPKTLDISAAGIVLSDAVSRNEVHWDGFVGWKETKNLFVLFLSEHRSVFFPKTAFASDEEREAMRALARFIPANKSTAFPIIHPDSGSSTPPPRPALNPASKE